MTWEMILPQLEMFGRVLLAAVCGLLIGLERETRMKDAGVRTHMMVALASALMMVVSKYGFFDLLSLSAYGDLIKLDPSRVASGIVTGIGFIGAGTIFVRRQVVSGLTTAAGLWATVGVGMAIGAGMYGIGIACTLVILAGQYLLHNRHIRLFQSSPFAVTLQFVEGQTFPEAMRDILKEQHIQLISLKSTVTSRGLTETELMLKLPKGYSRMALAVTLQQIPGVRTVEF